MISLNIEQKQQNQLELEVVTLELKMALARLLKKTIKENFNIYFMNDVINIARGLADLGPYVVEDDGDNGYEPADELWHRGEFYSAICRLGTLPFIEFCIECVNDGRLNLKELNKVLVEAGAGFSFTFEGTSCEVLVLSIEEYEDLRDNFDVEFDDVAHRNIRFLAQRMEYALEAKDYPNVLHAAASIFETLAKEVVEEPNVQNKTLGSFFSRYRIDSKIPEPILDFIGGVYAQRNRESLSGHGSLATPQITHEEASTLVTMTKAIVIVEKDPRKIT